MSQLMVIGFDDEAEAFALRQDLAKAQTEYLIRLEDAVVVTRPTAGEYQLHQAINLAGAGALGGTFWGGLVGLLFLNPLAGAAVGAASGALAGRMTDYGVNDDFVREVGKTVPVGSAAVFILSREMNLDKVLPRLERFGTRARVIQTSMTNDDEARLRQALSGAPWAESDAAARHAGQWSAAETAGSANPENPAAPQRTADMDFGSTPGVATSAGADPTVPPKL